MHDDDLVDTAGAAQLLRRSSRTLADWRWKRCGPPWLAVQGRVLYRRADVLAYLDDRVVRPDVLRRARTSATILA